MFCLALLLITSRLLAVDSSGLCSSQGMGVLLQSGVISLPLAPASSTDNTLLPTHSGFQRTFIKAFDRVPSVAISISELLSRNNIFCTFLISVRPIITTTLFSLNVVINPNVSRFVKLTIGFLAEAHFNLEAVSLIQNLSPISNQSKLFSISTSFSEKWDKIQSVTITGFLNGINFTDFSPGLQDLTYVRWTVVQNTLVFYFEANQAAANRNISFSYIMFSNKTSADISQLVFTKASGNYRSPIGSRVQATDKFISGLTSLRLRGNEQALSFNATIFGQQVAEIASNFERFVASFITIRETKCSNCPEPSYLLGNTCVQSCAKNQYITYKGECISCPPNQKPEEERCVCKDGAQSSMGFCVECVQGFVLRGGLHCFSSSFLAREPLAINPCITRTGAFFNGIDCMCRRTSQKWDPSCTAEVYPKIGARLQKLSAPGPGGRYFTVCPDGYVDTARNGECGKCSYGCGKCVSESSCLQCIQGFELDTVNKICTEICGDGKRFVVQCDDQNKIDGDGCNSKCQIQSQYNCQGGSSQTKDICLTQKPTTLSLIGVQKKTRKQKKMQNFRFRINWLPIDYLRNGCSRCANLFNVTIIQPNKDLKYELKYLPTTRYDFQLTIFLNDESDNAVARVEVKSSFQTPQFSGINIAGASINLN